MNKSLSNTKKHQMAISGLPLHIWKLIRNYYPDKDTEIRRLLEVYNQHLPTGIQKYGFIERLSEYWNIKIMFHLDELWKEVREAFLSDDERNVLLGRVKELNNLIIFAANEVTAVDFQDKPLDFFNERNHCLHLKTIQSFLEDPFLDGEARIISNRLSGGCWEYASLKIFKEYQVEPEFVTIRPLQQLAKDDDMGHMMRHEGMVESWPVGRIIVAGWNLPLTETEEGEYLVSIEHMLVDFGGCPLGYIYDSNQLRQGLGYNPVEKTCSHCWKKEFCPGNKELRAWTLGHLADKLHYAWQHRTDILKVIPEFQKKLLK